MDLTVQLFTGRPLHASKPPTRLPAHCSTLTREAHAQGGGGGDGGHHADLQPLLLQQGALQESRRAGYDMQ